MSRVRLLGGVECGVGWAACYRTCNVRPCTHRAVETKSAREHTSTRAASPPHGLGTQVVINELPPGREPVTTRVLVEGEQGRAELYAHMRAEVAAGGQVYIVCPLVEGSSVPVSVGGWGGGVGEWAAAIPWHRSPPARRVDDPSRYPATHLPPTPPSLRRPPPTRVRRALTSCAPPPRRLSGLWRRASSPPTSVACCMDAWPPRRRSVPCARSPRGPPRCSSARRWWR